MAQKTDAELDIEKDVIKNETDAGDNTATRVGQMFEDINDSKINNDKIDTADTLDTAGKTVPGRDAVKAYIDSQSGGSGTFEGLTDDPRDNPDLADYLDEKSDALPTTRSLTGAHTLDATDLGFVNDGASLIISGNSTGALTVPLNATVAFAIGSFFEITGYTGSVIATGGVTINGTRGDLTLPAGVDTYLEYLGSDTWTLHNGIQASDITGFNAAALAAAPAETTTTAGALINGATSKATPVDADFVGLMDSAASNILKKLSWANIKATLLAYFDTIYAPILDALQITSSGATHTLNFASKRERIFYGDASFTGSKTIALSNDSNAKVFNYHVTITTSAAITMPSSFSMDTNESRWSSGTKILTLTGSGDYLISGVYDLFSSEWRINASANGGYI